MGSTEEAGPARLKRAAVGDRLKGWNWEAVGARPEVWPAPQPAASSWKVSLREEGE